ncbi:hypothetical protein FQN54_007090 [Arachnomyces sp. PD_36]|nr:hypothetical protein FQN54_007090 [Arachnomyces sp. PD_36]
MAAAAISAMTSLAATAVIATATATITATSTSTSHPWEGDGDGGGGGGDGDGGHKWQDQVRGQRDLYTQIVISFAFGFGAFLTFCALRPKWKELYSARKLKPNTSAAVLPVLPDTFFGWIPAVYRITEDEVLDLAGMDAFVFLSFYKYAIKFLSGIFFFAVVVILPIHYTYTGKWFPDGDLGGGTKSSTMIWGSPAMEFGTTDPLDKVTKAKYKTYLWMYVVFTYVFTGMGIYLLIQETNKIIRTRQRYLGTQTSTTDKTIRLSGIPPQLRSEEKIKEFLENLRIGKVEKVMLCRDWQRLDRLMKERLKTLKRIEGAWTKHVGYRQNRKSSVTPSPPLPQYRASSMPLNGPDERTELLSEEEGVIDGAAHVQDYERPRPTIRIWYGPFKLQSKKIDEIDYYEERLRRIDEMIRDERQKECAPMPLAFVTMESIAASQMAVQAILDPSPLQLIASLAPAPSDVVWRNTYLSRTDRMVRSWSITLLIGVLTVFWSVLLVPVAYMLNLESIHKVFPGLADALSSHPLAKTLVQTGLPTLLLSLLTVIVPFLYNGKSKICMSPGFLLTVPGLSNLQGMTSQGDVELSVISKNFFFTFFNLFLVFTVFGTASNFYKFWGNLRDAFKDTTTIIFALAQSLEKLAHFYVNLIILQGLGLFPFRLLEFGAVSLYPFRLLGAKTPRDHAELPNPPNFSYGLSLPHTLLIFIICVVYSVFPSSWLICLFGLIYFAMGSFIYKYQLLYAMDHQQHSTGNAWPMICSRVILGFVVFQLAMIGILALRTAITRSILLVPLLAGTLWFSYFFARTYEPLMKFIALRSIDRDDNNSHSPTTATITSGAASTHSPSPPPQATLSPPSGWDRDSVRVRIGSHAYDHLEKYVNPSISQPLYGPWIPGQPPPTVRE